MQVISIQVQRLYEQTPILQGTEEWLKTVPNLNIFKVAILEAGTESGATSLMVCMKDGSGKTFIAELTGDMWNTINGARIGAEANWAENENPNTQY